MKPNRCAAAVAFGATMILFAPRTHGADLEPVGAEHPFQNFLLPAEERITDLLSLMTVDEKVACLSTNSGVPRLGVPGTRHVEGLHGLALGGPGRRPPDRR